MSVIAKSLEISRAHLSESVKLEQAHVRAKRYIKQDDETVLSMIKKIIDKRPSYGYRRVTAMLKREQNNLGLEPFNHKRIYRIMRANNLLLQRFTGKSTKTHDGKVVTLASNMRWSADTFSITNVLTVRKLKFLFISIPAPARLSAMWLQQQPRMGYL